MRSPWHFARTLVLQSRQFRVRDGRDSVIHMILVTCEAVLTRFAGGVAGLTPILFHRTEPGDKIVRIALLVAFQIRAVFIQLMAGEATALSGNAEMRFVDKLRKAALLPLDGQWREIDGSALSPNLIDAVAFRA